MECKRCKELEDAIVDLRHVIVQMQRRIDELDDPLRRYRQRGWEPAEPKVYTAEGPQPPLIGGIDEVPQLGGAGETTAGR